MIVQRGSLWNVAWFQVVWIVCAVGAAQGLSWPALVSAAALIAWHCGSRQNHTSILTIVLTGCIGFAAESLLAATGLVRYAASWPIAAFAPAWIVALWLAFATTLRATRALLGVRPLWKPAVLGALFGPLSYAAGERLGALAISSPAMPSYLAIAVIWAIAMPLLLLIDERFDAMSR
jgi:Protein of unknown function (DUF2878)